MLVIVSVMELFTFYFQIMRIFLFLALFITGVCYQSLAQNTCASFDYRQQVLLENPALQQKEKEAEKVILQQIINGQVDLQRLNENSLITIPVVVHILYHQPGENISDEQVFKQLNALNECFRRQNADTANTPAWFKPIAADCKIEFKLAITDPQKRATTGIVRTYTPVEKWNIDDEMKFTLKGGDNAWDSENYLNIWVCNLNRIIGYASFPGGPAEKDGIVINYSAFGTNGTNLLGKTAVHETGHWLGLRHIWGDEYCGDDLVDDTPRQGNFTSGCPSGIRKSCNNGSYGDMYMNYMDITSDACTNLFTLGQKARMRTLFAKGGPRVELLTSYGLLPPLINEIPLPEELPNWYYSNLFPNPASAEVTLDLSYDIRWVGNIITVTSMEGRHMMQVQINSKIMKINVANMKPGVYFLTAKREDGTTIKHKLIKM